MAENGAITAGQDCCHPPPFIAQAGVTDSVNPSMNAVQAAGADAIRNPAREHTGAFQLSGS
jgi:hypothetical protein